MRRRRLKRLALGLVAVLASGALADASGGAAQFEAKGPAGLKIIGKTQQVESRVSADDVQVTVALGALATGIDLRDKHLREKYLQTAQYPSAVLKTPWSALKVPNDGQSAQGSAQGTLSLHGQVKPVTFSYTAQRQGQRFTVKGDLPIHLADFGIEQPRYMGLTVQPDVTAHVETVVVRP